MKKADYEALEKAIKTHTITTLEGEYIAARSFIDSLCAILKAENPKFDEKKFREGCEF